MEELSRSEFRKDIVSGDWILMASERLMRPRLIFSAKRSRRISKKNCPFENPQKSGNPEPILWYPFPDASNVNNSTKKSFKDWFLQIIPNKYPALTPNEICPQKIADGPYMVMKGSGFHEVIITRDHNNFLAQMSQKEIVTVLKAFQDRYLMLKKEPCLKYILIFHNHGEAAGASISHPHSQLVALPILPPDVASSLRGSIRFFHKNQKCVHCVMIEWEINEKNRVIAENQDFIAVCPFASRVSYEIRIFPKKHSPHFENIGNKERDSLAEIFKRILFNLHKTLKNPDYNFFIHTAPLIKMPHIEHYHWHIEILPRTYKWAGLELGTGIEIVAVLPEKAASDLRKC
jgi:UDPglucose--hexose-1-phosphate uridylyltransferase